MTLFLLTHDRRTRRTDVEPIGDESIVLEKLFAAEARIRTQPDLEVVLLSAADEDDLRRTHSRYFESVEELLAG